jgi:aldehyde dehydrogenase (NAD+)
MTDFTFIDQSFLELKKNRWAVSTTSAKERKNKLLRLKNVIMRRREDIKESIYLDFKKPYPESELTEIHTAIDEINFAVKKLKKWMKPKRVKSPLVLFGSQSFIQYEAKGVVLILSPWNYPFALMINPLVAAVAAGNCVMARPSEKTPHTGNILKEIIEEVFPTNEISFFLGEIELSQKMVSLPFDHLFFTGSTQVGRLIMMEAAKNLTPVTLELGGKSPVIIDKDVDLQDCVEKIFWGKFVNGGQTCVAPDYVYLPQELKNDFVSLFKKEILKRFGETSVDRLSTKDFARIVDVAGFERLAKKIEGEKRLLEDQVLKEDRFIPPTLLLEASKSSPIMIDEIFGPILPIFTYDSNEASFQNALNYINSQSKPLALYIFSKNNHFIKKILRETTSGGVAINHVILHLANPYLPFGGVGHSGIGSYHGEFGFKTFSHERAVLKQGRLTLSKLYFPPYSTWLSQIAFKVLRFLE